MAMKFLKGTTGSKRGFYNLVSRHTKLPKMQEVEILPWGGGVGLALRWRGGSATLGLPYIPTHRHDRICSMNDPDKGCLLGGVEECRIGSEKVLSRAEKKEAATEPQRLIDANALKYSRVQIFYGLRDNGEPLVGGMNAVVMSCAIKDAPTIDAVEVVRCKDCVYYKPGKHFKDINFCQRLPYYAEKGGLNVSDEDFCSHGERRNADKSRDLSGYADKLREIKEEKAKKAMEKAEKFVEKALEKVGL